MDGFSLFLNFFCLVGQCILQMAFVSRLTGRHAGFGQYAAYLLLCFGLEALSLHIPLNGISAASAELLALWGVCCLGLRTPKAPALAAASIAIYTTLLSFGLVNSIQMAVLPPFIGNPLLYFLVLLSSLVSFVLCGGCYAAVLKTLSLREERGAPSARLLLFPGLFFFAAELYILQTAYSEVALPMPPDGWKKHGALLFFQGMGLAALLCTLYAYRRFRQGLQAQAALQTLTQAAEAQRIYIAEARARYEQTRAFRHDIQNHLSVLDGLLRSGKTEEGRTYLQTLSQRAAALSFPYRTGNPVVDILLGEKLSLAGEIAAEVSVVLPEPCGIDDFDLCVIFANALDNAIRACRSCEGAPSLRITGKRQGDFYMLHFENTCPAGPLPPAGTGLASIRAAAEKYRGAVSAEKNGQHFSLHILLNASAP